MFFYSSFDLHLVFGLFATSLLRFGLTTPTLMKAIVMEGFGRSDVLTIKDVPVPPIMEEEVLIKVKAAGVNPVDVHIRTGTVPIRAKLPLILGKEVAGYVEKVDSSVKLFKEGDRVFCGVTRGGYAEYTTTAETYCFPLPERLTFSQGASIFITYFACYKALVLKGDIHRGDTILVHGASGGVGSAAVQVAKHLGAYVIASVGSHYLRKVMEDSGADYVTFHGCGDYLDVALKGTNKTGFDAILEITGKLNIEFDKQYLTETGKILVMGNRAFSKMVNNPSNVVIEDPSVIINSFFGYSKAELKAAGYFIVDGIEKGIITPIIGREYDFEDVARAQYEVFYGKSLKGKIILLL